MGNYGGCDTCGSRGSCDCVLRAQLAEAQGQVQALTWELEGERRNAAWEAERAVNAVDELASQSATLSRLREALENGIKHGECNHACYTKDESLCGDMSFEAWSAAPEPICQCWKVKARAALSLLNPVASETKKED